MLSRICIFWTFSAVCLSFRFVCRHISRRSARAYTCKDWKKSCKRLRRKAQSKVKCNNPTKLFSAFFFSLTIKSIYTRLGAWWNKFWFCQCNIKQVYTVYACLSDANGQVQICEEKTKKMQRKIKLPAWSV